MREVACLESGCAAKSGTGLTPQLSPPSSSSSSLARSSSSLLHHLNLHHLYVELISMVNYGHFHIALIEFKYILIFSQTGQINFSSRGVRDVSTFFLSPDYEKYTLWRTVENNSVLKQRNLLLRDGPWGPTSLSTRETNPAVHWKELEPDAGWRNLPACLLFF